MVETFLHRVVPAVVQTHLCRSDRDWALLRDKGCKLDGCLEALSRSLSDFAEESALESLLRREKAGCVCQLSCPAIVAHNFLEALQCPNVCSQADIDFLDGELGPFGCNPDICGRAQVDTSSDTEAIDGCYDRNPHFLKAGDTLLQRAHNLEKVQRGTSRIFLRVAQALHLSCRRQVQPGRKMLSLSREHDSSDLAAGSAKILKHLLDLVKHLERDCIEFLGSIHGDHRHFVVIKVLYLHLRMVRLWNCSPHFVRLYLKYYYKIILDKRFLKHS